MSKNNDRNSGQRPNRNERNDRRRQYADILIDEEEPTSVKEEAADGSDEKQTAFDLKPKEIKAYLDRFVIGQEEAKKVLAVAAYNHYKRIRDESGLIRKSNVLLAGPTGCGKTFLVETLARVMNVPLVTVDATSLTESGYTGKNVENILTDLLEKADGCIEKAEKGIVFIDEIDKLACRGFNLQREAYCRGVQQGLLKIIEGGMISPPSKMESKNRRVLFDTRNVLFICGGAFSGIDTEEPQGRPIGFLADAPAGRPRRQELSPEKLVEYGLMRELVGRLPVLVRINSLMEEDMVRVIRDTDDSLVREYTELLAQDGICLRFSDEAIRFIAHVAIRRRCGARGLRSLMEAVMTDVMFDAPDGGPGKKLVITRRMAEARLLGDDYAEAAM